MKWLHRQSLKILIMLDSRLQSSHHAKYFLCRTTKKGTLYVSPFFLDFKTLSECSANEIDNATAIFRLSNNALCLCSVPDFFNEFRQLSSFDQLIVLLDPILYFVF